MLLWLSFRIMTLMLPWQVPCCYLQNFPDLVIEHLCPLSRKDCCVALTYTTIYMKKKKPQQQQQQQQQQIKQTLGGKVTKVIIPIRPVRYAL